MTKKELIEICENLGLDYKKSMTKNKLQELIDENSHEVESDNEEDIEWEFQIEYEEQEEVIEDYEIITVKKYCKKNNIVGIKKKFLIRKYGKEILLPSQWKEIIVKEKI